MGALDAILSPDRAATGKPSPENRPAPAPARASARPLLVRKPRPRGFARPRRQSDFPTRGVK